MERREFMGYLTVAALSSPVLLSEGCSTTEAAIMTDIKNWAPTGKTAFDAIATILIDSGVIPLGFAAQAIIDDLFNQLEEDASAYLAINPPSSGALAQVEATFNIILTNLQSFFAGLNIAPGSLLTLILGLAEIIFSTIAGFISQLPPSATLTSLKNSFGTAYRVGRRSITVVAVVRSRKKFEIDLNSVLEAGGRQDAFHLNWLERHL
jgi:hypothetical protein